MTKKKTVQLLSSPCDHGDALAEIDHGDRTQVTSVRFREPGDSRPLQPGETMMALEPAGSPGRFSVTGEYTHSGPSRAATPAYRRGWEAVFDKREPSSRPEDLN